MGAFSSASRIRRRQAGFSWLRILGAVVLLPVAGALLAGLVTTLAVLLANDRLPPLDALIDYRPKIPLRVYMPTTC